MEWKMPPKVKILEALGCVADERIVLNADFSGALVTSSTGNKKYTVTYDKKLNTVMSNDNASYYAGYLGYPAIAFIFRAGIISYEGKIATSLKGIPWKEVNVKYKNNYAETEAYAKSWALKSRVSSISIDEESARISDELAELHLQKLGNRVKPPEGF